MGKYTWNSVGISGISTKIQSLGEDLHVFLLGLVAFSIRESLFFIHLISILRSFQICLFPMSFIFAHPAVRKKFLNFAVPRAMDLI